MKQNDGLYDNLIAQVHAVTRHINEGSFNSRARNRTAMSVFCRFLADEFRLQKISNISHKHFEAWIQHMASQGRATSTIKSHLSGVRHILDHMPRFKGEIPTNQDIDALKTVPPRAFVGIDRAWTDSEFRNMVTLAYDLDESNIASAIELAHSIGPRIHEVLQIDYARAQEALRSGELWVKGKGGKWRALPVNDMVANILRKAMSQSQRGKRIFVDQNLHVKQQKERIQRFIRNHRSQFEVDSRVLEKRDGAYLREMGKQFGYKPHITYHGLRHSFSRRYYMSLRKKGYSHYQACKSVSKILGHERDSISLIYLGELGSKKTTV